MPCSPAGNQQTPAQKHLSSTKHFLEENLTVEKLRDYLVGGGKVNWDLLLEGNHPVELSFLHLMAILRRYEELSEQQSLQLR